jgi:hypothetical protein
VVIEYSTAIVKFFMVNPLVSGFLYLVVQAATIEQVGNHLQPQTRNRAGPAIHFFLSVFRIRHPSGLDG